VAANVLIVVLVAVVVEDLPWWFVIECGEVGVAICLTVTSLLFDFEIDSSCLKTN
jgi:hypothetical protein